MRDLWDAIRTWFEKNWEKYEVVPLEIFSDECAEESIQKSAQYEVEVNVINETNLVEMKIRKRAP